MDMSRSLYGNISAGLFFAQIQYAAPHGRILQGNIGIDAEQVRNFFQNKLVHRLFFFAKKGRWRGGSDLPMIDSEGNMYLYKKDQKIRPLKLYANSLQIPIYFIEYDLRFSFTWPHDRDKAKPHGYFSVSGLGDNMKPGDNIKLPGNERLQREDFGL